MRYNPHKLLIKFPAAFLLLVEYFGLFRVIHTSGFYTNMSMVAYNRTSEIDWTKIIMDDTFIDTSYILGSLWTCRS